MAETEHYFENRYQKGFISSLCFAFTDNMIFYPNSQNVVQIQ